METGFTTARTPPAMIVSGSASQSLAAALAAERGEELAAVEFERFPDGELLAAAPGFDGERATIVASTASNDAHVELLQLQDAVREAGAGEVVTVLPYLGYARQDRAVAPGKTAAESLPGYPLSVRAMGRAISTGTDRVVTVNPHGERVGRHFDVPVETVDAAPLLAEPLPALSDPVFIAPDDGAVGLAESAREAHGGGDVDYFEKTRLSGSEVELRPSEVDVAGRDAVLVDDIVATGSTMSEAVALLGEQDVARTFVTCVHPVFVGGARTRLARAGVEAVYATDTLERAESTVSVAPVVADALE